MTCALLCLLTATACGAQHVSFGVKAGVRATSDLEGYAVSESKRYTAGPSVEVALPRRFGVEFDVLYSRFGYRSYGGDFFGSYYQTNQRANVWEFPMLAKYRLHRFHGLLGYAPRRMSGSYHSIGVQGSYTGERTFFQSGGKTSYDVTHGLVTGGGVELGAGRLRVSPEVRYIRWNKDPVNLYGSRGFYVSMPQNEVKVLLGLTWR